MSDQSVSLDLLNPRGEVEKPPVYSPSPRLSDLSGKHIGLYSNKKNGVDHFFTALETLFKNRYPDITFSRLAGGFEIKDEDAGTFAAEIDGYIYAIGD